MIIEGAIGDAYGAGFEFADRAVIEQHNTLQAYIPHPVFPTILRRYTDDTQMSLALIELLLSGKAWTRLHIANAFVSTFKRDPREGYAKRFHAFLTEIRDGQELLDKIIAKSERNGAAMRAYPLGVFRDKNQILEWTKEQAEVTHQTYKAVVSAQAVAMISHFFLYNVDSKASLTEFIRDTTAYNWQGHWEQEVAIDGIQTVEAILSIMQQGTSLSQMLRQAVNLGGDVDTVASLVMAIGACTDAYVHDIPPVLFDQLEDGPYGKSYLMELEKPWQAFIASQQTDAAG